MTSNATEITGRGILSCLGHTVPDFSAAVLAGKGAIGDITDLLSIQKIPNGAPIRNFVPAEHFDERTLSFIDRFTQFAVVAARQAWKESGLDVDRPDPARVGVIIGTANGGIDILEEGFRRFLTNNLRPRPLTIPMTMSNAPASRIALEVGAHGPAFAISSACASAAHAVVVGNMLIRANLIDVCIVGGTDSNFTDGFLRAWDSLRVVAPDTCRPFSKGRQGLILGEGAGIMVLERAGRAAARGARVTARLLGGGMTCDAGDLLAPDNAGMANAMRIALSDAGLGPEAVDYINAHGTGTLANDRAESAAIHAVFDACGKVPPVSSTKSMIGHALGASGALEAITTLAALEHGIIPPTINFLEADPACNIDAVPNTPRKADLKVAISNSFAFGGLNVSLAFGRA
jgi:nodulation protein E